MSAFDPYVVLPAELVIPSVDDILYEIGLCLTSVSDGPKHRRLIHNPMFIIITCSIFIVDRFICVILNDKNEFY